MAWVPEARLPKALTEGLFVCIEEGTSKHATSHDDDIGDQTREGCAHHSSTGKGRGVKKLFHSRTVHTQKELEMQKSYDERRERVDRAYFGKAP